LKRAAEGKAPNNNYLSGALIDAEMRRVGYNRAGYFVPLFYIARNKRLRGRSARAMISRVWLRGENLFLLPSWIPNRSFGRKLTLMNIICDAPHNGKKKERGGTCTNYRQTELFSIIH